jgi:hypothetical protein
MSVPVSLRRWFVVHFIVDVLFAVPLLAVPGTFLRAVGWVEVDSVTARMVGAALAGIGVESYLCRNDGIETFRSMLRLKCIWSGAALLGLALSIAQGAPPFAWVALVIFVGFGLLWNGYRLKLRTPARGS